LISGVHLKPINKNSNKDLTIYKIMTQSENYNTPSVRSLVPKVGSLTPNRRAM